MTTFAQAEFWVDGILIETQPIKTKVDLDWLCRFINRPNRVRGVTIWL